MYYVYVIKINDKVRYIGITNNVKKREYQHNYECFNVKKDKILYNNIRKYNLLNKICLEIIEEFKSKSNAELYEAFLILRDYFSSEKTLWQVAPKKIKYY
jgi:predicted GIY-YIG superfamily endonuclease